MRQPLEKPFRADAIRQAVMSTPFDGQTLTTLSLAPTTRIEIGEALDKNWMELWYQPKVDLHRGTLVGVEGVVRCRHPVHGVLDSASFLSSENTEADTTALAEHELITALRDWNELSAAGPALRTAVNTSISALGNLHLPALCAQASAEEREVARPDPRADGGGGRQGPRSRARDRHAAAHLGNYAGHRRFRRGGSPPSHACESCRSAS